MWDGIGRIEDFFCCFFVLFGFGLALVLVGDGELDWIGSIHEPVSLLATTAATSY